MTAVEIGLAFIEGLALIASPCILPVLPLVLTASVDGGRRRPFGIITGFILSFSAFALLSRQLVTLLNIDLDTLKDVSLGLLFLFGMTLIIDRLSQGFGRLTRGLADVGNRLSSGATGGLASGVAIGSLIGLVWTPCAGPILATVLVQVIRQQTDISSLLIVLAFAVGAGIPMLIIALTGRRIMKKLSFFTAHAEAVRKAFGVVILLSVTFIASGVDAQSLFSRHGTREGNAPLTLEEGLRNPYPAPPFAGIQEWLNSKPLTMAQLKGKVVLVDFWTYSCINCVRTLPYVTAWDRKYRDKGLVIVGVHSPEFEFEKKLENVKDAVAAHNIQYPVALDNHLDTWSNFNNRYWPAHYLIDRNGNVVYTHFGEGKYDVTENNIRYLLGLKGKAAEAGSRPAFVINQTPETYLGYARSDSYMGDGTVVNDVAQDYRFPSFLPPDTWALSGRWNVQADKVVSGEAGAALQLNFTARKVFLVLGTATGKPAHARISLNGEPVAADAGKDAPGGRLTVDHSTLYELIDQPTARNSLLQIRALEPGLEAYAFTFGG